ncbi:class I SAM-dependent methyltransferase [Promicromonospora panici]|uniref:class I SAM-dependent methyltransferase n=1 Tax=Promicromonospora panici TaxID=2219658 RepID=UPI0013EB1185|nr:class I SAM-dependent methyltransferase [Promicromonospora panici]
MSSFKDDPGLQIDPGTRRTNFVTYYDAESADRGLRPVPEWRRAAQEEFLARLAQERRRTVLELGCGPGRDGKAIAAAGFGYTGTDLSPGMVDVARTADLDARVASATDLPFDDDSFDAAWSMSMLMHLDDAELDLALAQISRVLMPGALFAAGMWGASELTVGHVSAPGEDYGPPRYFHRRTDAMVRERLGRHGDIETWWTRPSGPGSSHHYQYAVIRTFGSGG